MNINDIYPGMMIELLEDHNKWGIVTSISDNNTGVYYRSVSGDCLFILPKLIRCVEYKWNDITKNWDKVYKE